MDLAELVKKYKYLSKFIRINKSGKYIMVSRDINDHVKLLKIFFNDKFGIVEYNIPQGCLIPRYSSRKHYIIIVDQWLKKNLKNVKFDVFRWLDVGTGASGIFSLILACEFAYPVLATDTSVIAINNLQNLLDNNSFLKEKIIIHHILDQKILLNLPLPCLVSVCNPPFYSSYQEAESKINFKKCLKSGESIKKNGLEEEIVYQNGGEKLFIINMLKESQYLFLKNKPQCLIYTSLIAKRSTLKAITLYCKNIREIKYCGCIGTIGGFYKKWIFLWTYVELSLLFQNVIEIFGQP